MKPIFSITDYTIEEHKKAYPMYFYTESNAIKLPVVFGELHFSIVANNAGTCSGVDCSTCPLNNKGCNSIAEILSIINHYLPDAKTLHPEFFV